MRVAILCQYYVPEEVGIGVQIHQLAKDLVERGHEVTVLTAFPNYPSGEVSEPYRRKRFLRETIEGVKVLRSWIFATPSKNISRRALSFGSFCASAFLGAGRLGRLDALYVVMPPLPLGLTAHWICRMKGGRFIANIQDIYPHAAVALGVMKNPRLIRFFERMERKIYRRAAKIAVISDGFRENLLGKGVPPDKVLVIPNWIDSSAIKPGNRMNSFRESLGIGDDFAVVYSGSLSLNSDLEPLIRGAALLQDEAVRFVIVGDGVHKQRLVSLVDELQLKNVVFRPFQPLERYPEVLAAADLTVVTLNTQATHVSVPSKIYKQMAAARPILAVAQEGNELERLVSEAKCGLSVPPGSPEALAKAVRWAVANRQDLQTMGMRAREYVMERHDRKQAVDQIERALEEARR
jgi:colanic acid biosynthesis glycosyl transferase WcaI